MNTQTHPRKDMTLGIYHEQGQKSIKNMYLSPINIEREKSPFVIPWVIVGESYPKGKKTVDT